MNQKKTITNVYIPSYGNSFTVGINNVSAIKKTTDGVVIYSKDGAFTEYTDIRCVFKGEMTTIGNNEQL